MKFDRKICPWASEKKVRPNVGDELKVESGACIGEGCGLWAGDGGCGLQIFPRELGRVAGALERIAASLASIENQGTP